MEGVKISHHMLVVNFDRKRLHCRTCSSLIMVFKVTCPLNYVKNQNLLIQFFFIFCKVVTLASSMMHVSL